MCHLHVEPENISIWSTPAISQHKEFEVWEMGRYKRLNSISLNPNSCTGISFFMRDHCVIDIHPHSTRYPPTHVEKFRYMEEMFTSAAGDDVAWIYMPLAAQDEITAVRARTQVTPDTPHYFTVRSNLTTSSNNKTVKKTNKLTLVLLLVLYKGWRKDCGWHSLQRSAHATRGRTGITPRKR